jgi:hypothetical protein
MSTLKWRIKMGKKVKETHSLNVSFESDLNYGAVEK